MKADPFPPFIYGFGSETLRKLRAFISSVILHVAHLLQTHTHTHHTQEKTNKLIRAHMVMITNILTSSFLHVVLKN